MDAIVVGAGIAGLTLALSLHRIGISVRVYEAAPTILPLGVGINLQPPAVRVLTELGLRDELASAGLAVDALSLFNKFGQLISREPRGVAAGYRWPQYAIHRGKLQSILLAAVSTSIGPEIVVTGMRLEQIVQTPGQVVATFQGPKDGSITQMSADMLIGADGIHSTVRRHVFPENDAPRFANQILWRSAVESDAFLDGKTMVIAGHREQRIIVYPIAQAATPGRQLINWICQKSVHKDHSFGQNWNRRVSPVAVFEAFAGWRFDWLDLPDLVRASGEIFEFPLVDRDPIPRWSLGRVTLIGDAAHPMQPIGGQAGSQAIVDAQVFVDALVEEGDVVTALQTYEACRRPAMNEVTLRNRQLGPEMALQLVEERAPSGFKDIADVISAEELIDIAGTYARVAGLDVATVNACR